MGTPYEVTCHQNKPVHPLAFPYFPVKAKNNSQNQAHGKSKGEERVEYA